MRQRLVAGNWKMRGCLSANQQLLDSLVQHLSSLSDVEVAVCVPFPYLAQAKTTLLNTQLTWGAQDVSSELKGPFTGEVSAEMLQDFGCKYVIVGHSERRALYGETNHIAALKYQAAQLAGLKPIFCVSESLEEFEAGNSKQVVLAQLETVIHLCGVESLKHAVVAYEPFWAIGGDISAPPEHVQSMHSAIRKYVETSDKSVADHLQIVYGGSIKAANAAQLLSQPDVDGGIVGAASLDAVEFSEICRSARKLS